jgi:hypothetical protein
MAPQEANSPNREAEDAVTFKFSRLFCLLLTVEDQVLLLVMRGIQCYSNTGTWFILERICW